MGRDGGMRLAGRGGAMVWAWIRVQTMAWASARGRVIPRALLATLLLLATGPVLAATCGTLPSAYPVFGGTSMHIGTGDTVYNGTNTYNVNGGTAHNFVTASAIDPNSGTILTTVNPTLPALSPSAFPTFSTGSTNSTLSSNGTLAAGSYGTVTVSANSTNVSLTGGTYYINTLTINGGTSTAPTTVSLGTGTYYINTITFVGDYSNLNLAAGNYFVNNATSTANYISISVPSGGPANYFIGTTLALTGNYASLNQGGSVTALMVYAYQTGQGSKWGMDLGPYSYFSGVFLAPYMPSPSSNQAVRFGDNSTTSGTLYTVGQIYFGNYDLVNYTSSTQSQVAGISTCVTGSFTIASTAGNLCAGPTLTLTVKDVSGNTITNYTGTIRITSNALSGAYAKGSTANGTLTNTSTGIATYAFTAADSGVAKLVYTPTATGSYNFNVVDVAVPLSTTTTTTSTSVIGCKFTVAFTAGSTSPCTGPKLTITALDANNATIASYTGTVKITASNGSGDYAAGTPAPTGTLNNGTANDGIATYAFAATDLGVVNLTLTTTVAASVTFTVVDNAVASSSTTSASTTIATCVIPVDHFALAVSAGGVCAGPTLGIVAKDASNNTITGYTGTIKITASNATGDYAAGTYTGTLNNGTANDGIANYTFVATDLGAIALVYNTFSTGSVSFTVVDTSISSSSTTSSSITLAAEGFVITPDPIQVAGRPQTMTVTVKKNASGSCATDTTYTGAKNLDAWITPDASDPNGTTTSTNDPTIGAATNYLPRSSTAPAVNSAANNISLTFASGVATLVLNTTDVGKYVLNLRDDTIASLILGSTTTLTVRPFAIAFAAITGVRPNPAANTATGATTLATTLFTTAGKPFSATIGAYRWSLAFDKNNNGVWDDDVTGDGAFNYLDYNQLANPTAPLVSPGLTPSYKWDTVLTASQDQPSAALGGVFGTFTGGTVTAASFTNGQGSLNTLSYAEVGSILMSANATNFLNTAGVNLTAPSGPVGRFGADHFALAVTTAGVLGAGCGGFTYVDQGFGYSATRGTQPVIQVKALAQGGATALQNYHDFTAGGTSATCPTNCNWWLLPLATPVSPSTVGITDAYTNLTALTGNIAADFSTVSHSPTTGSGSHGAVSLTLSASLAYAARNAPAVSPPVNPVVPFNPGVQAVVTARDSDGASGAVTLSSTVAATNPLTFTPALPVVQPLWVRWGRLRLGTAAGPAQSPLVLPATVEYYNGNSAFVTATDDTCTGPALTTANTQLYNVSPYNTPGTATGSLNVTGGTCPGTGTGCVTATWGGFANGVGGLTLTPPGASFPGYIEVQLNLTTGAGLGFLRYDWYTQYANSSLQLQNDPPRGRADFGIYGQPEKVIYTRQLW
jgi:hypothetical protein